jgi:hypothetical protein
VISKNASVESLSSSCPTSFSCTTTGTITTYLNQLIATLTKNGNSVGTTNTAIIDTAGNTIGTYSYVFSNAGNANYTSNSLTDTVSLHVPVYFSNATSTADIFLSKAINTHYPYKFYNAISSNSISYTLKQTYQGITTAIQSNAAAISYIPPANQPIPLASCTNNLTSGNCIGNLTYTSATTLTGNINVTGNIRINSGIALTTSGYYITATGLINWSAATIKTGINNMAGGGIADTSGNSIITSYGSSGGGGGGSGASSNAGGGGGATTANGGTGGTSGGGTGNGGIIAAFPALNNQLIRNWNANGIINYLTGAGGGGGGTSIGDGGGGTGGTGGYGLYLQAYTVKAGNIITTGGTGNVGASGTNYGGGGGAGGGAGSILIAYNKGGNYSAGTYSESGGGGGAGGGAGVTNGGGGGLGGSGNVITYSFATPPLGYTYTYEITEMQNSNTVSSNLTVGVSMTSINSVLTFNSYSNGCIQLLPCLAANAVFTAKPTSWSIRSDLPLNQHNNITASTANFSNANITLSNFPNRIALTYGQFSPAISFNLNATDNPSVQNSITQTKFNFTLSNAVITGRRLIANFSVFSQQTFNSLNATVQLAINGTINGYKISSAINDTSASKYYWQMLLSTYENPPLFYNLNDTALVTAGAFFSHSDTFCPTTMDNGNDAYYPLGIVSANGSRFNAYIYTQGGQTASNYLLQIIEQKGAGTTQVQQVKVPPSLPMVVALQSTGQNYAFDVYSPTCSKVYYKGVLTQPSNPIYITLNVSPAAFTYNTTNATASCKIINTTSTLYKVSCFGADPTSITYKYQLFVFNETSVIGTTEIVHNANFTGSSFAANFTLPVNHTYSYRVVGYAYKQFDPATIVGGGVLTISKIQIASPLLGIVAFIILLVFALGGAGTGKPIVLLGLTEAGFIIVGLIIQIPTYVAFVFLVLSLIVGFWARKRSG